MTRSPEAKGQSVDGESVFATGVIFFTLGSGDTGALHDERAGHEGICGAEALPIET